MVSPGKCCWVCCPYAAPTNDSLYNFTFHLAKHTGDLDLLGTAITQSCLEESSRATTSTQPTHLSFEYVAVQVGRCTPKLDDLMDTLTTEHLTLPAHHGSDVGRAFSVTQVHVVPRLTHYLCPHKLSSTQHPLKRCPQRLARVPTRSSALWTSMSTCS